MRVHLQVGLLFVLCSAAECVWPQPVSLQQGASSRHVSANFTCVVGTAGAAGGGSSQGSQQGDLLTAACNRYEGYIRSTRFPVSRRPGTEPHDRLGGQGADDLLRIEVSAADTSTAFGLRTDESYNLTIGATGPAQLHAAHAVGVLRGLESFFQLLEPLLPGEFTILAPTVLHDRPRWPHRGLLVDTGRHYYPVDFLKHIIDGMAMEKLSVLHWHITEILSFPLVVESVPDLAATSAFSPAATYSHADVKAVVEHARLSGVRVIPELDMPGHMTAWGTALPELGIVMDCGTAHHQSNFSQADVSKEATFTVIEKVLKEIVPLFPDKYWGFGGDETCDWMSTPHIASWAANHSGQPGFEANMSSHGALYRYFGKRVQDMLPMSKLPAWWNDAVVQNVTTPAEALFWNWGAGCSVYDKATKTHINKCPVGDELTGMLRAGRQVVQSHGWYVGPSETTDIASDPLRATFAGQYCGGDADSNGGGSWVDFYNKDPEWNATSATTEELKNLLGGEISSWGECRSPENFDQLVYPKMSAVGERLWSSASSNRSIVAAYPRLLEHRCRMVRRGIQVGVLSPGSCYTYPYSVNALSANE